MHNKSCGNFKRSFFSLSSFLNNNSLPFFVDLASLIFFLFYVLLFAGKREHVFCALDTMIKKSISQHLNTHQNSEAKLTAGIVKLN